MRVSIIIVEIFIILLLFIFRENDKILKTRLRDNVWLKKNLDEIDKMIKEKNNETY